MEEIVCKNPFNGDVLGSYRLFSEKEVDAVLMRAEAAFVHWQKEPVPKRVKLLESLSRILEHNKLNYAKLMTLEMGKPITESIAEIEKCIWLTDFYAKNADRFLSDEMITTEARESFVSHDPLGCILGVMPWNFPFWQVFRFAVPAITAGNVVILKHASNVNGCANILYKLFTDAGYPEGCFQVLIMHHDYLEKIVASPVVKGVSLTGSVGAGKSIAAMAGKYLKKCVLELGGNNACVIWEDADLDKHLDTMVRARMQNTGQSCIAAKRFIVVEEIYDRFLKAFESKIQKLVSGNPMDENTQIGVLAKPDLADTLEKQVLKSIEMGAHLVLGNQRKNNYYEPTILTEVDSGMPAFDEELFGPVAAICKVKDRAASIQMAANSSFGLGTMLFTRDIEAARKVVDDIPDGSFFVNEMVKSHPSLPFGGTKDSGYGRELSQEGILEFVNKKTVYIA